LKLNFVEAEEGRRVVGTLVVGKEGLSFVGTKVVGLRVGSGVFADEGIEVVGAIVILLPIVGDSVGALDGGTVLG
jgi:hypothetical protein